jgi:hypothetical protein
VQATETAGKLRESILNECFCCKKGGNVGHGCVFAEFCARRYDSACDLQAL